MSLHVILAGEHELSDWTELDERIQVRGHESWQGFEMISLAELDEGVCVIDVRQLRSFRRSEQIEETGERERVAFNLDIFDTLALQGRLARHVAEEGTARTLVR